MKTDSYYTTEKPHLLRDFDRMSGMLQKVLAASLGNDLAPVILQETRREFEALLPQLPYIGGKENRHTRDVIGTSYGLALYKVLTARGRPVEEIAQVVYALAEAKLDSLPWTANLGLRLLRALLPTSLGKRIFKARLKKRAAESQARRIPGDAVAYYVEGEGREFDCGIDIVECPIVNFFRAQGAGEFVRYACLYDFPASRLSGTGLVRTMTLAEGAEKCDDRFRFGKQPENRQKTQIALDTKAMPGGEI